MSGNAHAEEPGSVTAQVEMDLAGTQVQFTLTVPQAPVPPGSLLPILHVLSEAVQNGVAEALESGGKRISCRAGCGAAAANWSRSRRSRLVGSRNSSNPCRSRDGPRSARGSTPRFDACTRRACWSGSAIPNGFRRGAGSAGAGLFRPGHLLPLSRGRIVLDPCRPAAGLPRIPGDVSPRVLHRPGGRASRGGQAAGPSFERSGPAGGSGDPGAQAVCRTSPPAGVGGPAP